MTVSCINLIGQQSETSSAIKISVLKTELTTDNCALLSLQTLFHDDIMNLQMRCYRSTVALVSLVNTALTCQGYGRFFIAWFSQILQLVHGKMHLGPICRQIQEAQGKAE